MHKIIPHLWFDTQAIEAVNFYISLFSGSEIDGITVIKDTPSGDCDFVNFTLAGHTFSAISAGPYFTLNPSISLAVAFEQEKELCEVWEKLSEDGEPLMPLQEYPFCPLYGWIQDRFGLSWQLMLLRPGDITHKIIYSFLFSQAHNGLSEAAAHYYMDVFEEGELNMLEYYEPNEVSPTNAKVKYLNFNIVGEQFSMMDNAYDTKYDFNEGFSFMIMCENQAEIDYYWEKLSHNPEAEQCGWCKDRFGVSWQIVAANWDEVLFKGTEEEKARVTEAFLQMKKFDLAQLERARKGE
ncbi:MAG: VOC family protein [Erysipelotrichaceae bacterium]|nr:VOC family protein [Erysipelotrichaceae bacterium]